MHDESNNLFGHDALLSAAAADDFENHLDRWIVEQMLLDCEEWDDPPKSARLLVRLSDESIKSPDLVLHLERLLKKSRIDGRRLIFEVSEEVATGHVRNARGFVQALKRLGCLTVLERFGARLNSFRTLKHLDVDFLKIAESVTEDLVDNPSTQSAIRRIQEMAHLSNKSTIVTQVRGARSLALLWDMGVNYVQGDYTQYPAIELRSVSAAPSQMFGEDPGLVH